MRTLGELTCGSDVTEAANRLVPISPQIRDSSFPPVSNRSIVPTTLFDCLSIGKRPLSVSLTDVKLGASELDLSALSQLVDRSQTRFIAYAIDFLARSTGEVSIKESVGSLIKSWEENLLTGDVIDEGFRAGIRPVDLGMVLNRIRGIEVKVIDT